MYVHGKIIRKDSKPTPDKIRKSFIIPANFLLRTIIWSKKTSAKKQLPYSPVMGWKPITRAMLSPKKLKYLIFRFHCSSLNNKSKQQNVTVNKLVA